MSIGGYQLGSSINSGIPGEYILGVIGLIIVCNILLIWFSGWADEKGSEKRKKKFGDDYQDEALRRFKEKYPGKGIGSYEYVKYYDKIEREVLKERGAGRFD